MTEADRRLPAMPGPLELSAAWVAPFAACRLMADLGRTAFTVWPATMLVAPSPFLWAPPFWVLALMTGGGGASGIKGAVVPARLPAAPASARAAERAL